jgi:hypothetical protein
MKIGTWGKRTILLLLLIGVHVIFGIACQRVQVYYKSMFANWNAFLLTLMWIFVSFFLVMIVAGLVVCLVRPYRVIMLGLALSAFVMMILWGVNFYVLIAGLFYWLIASLYAYFVVRSLANSICFSLQPVVRGQNLLAFAMALMLGVSFAIAYEQSMVESQSTIPPMVKQVLTNLSIRSFDDRLETQGVGDRVKAITLQEAGRELDMLWSGLERTLNPFAGLVLIAAGIAVSIVLEIIFICFAWLPSIFLELLFLILPKLNLIRMISETKQTQRFVLD